MPASVGPEKFGGLPGAILRLDADSGGIVFSAIRVDPAVRDKDLRAPAGKPISRADYEKAAGQGPRPRRRTGTPDSAADKLTPNGSFF
ncbi:hypothetical protein ACQ86N_37840 [Puia sp. P3]|uniref:hypothetical protein n=1 Tax=Puia sp. P3 TaxID=3423952 RepID=UPI003D6740D0